MSLYLWIILLSFAGPFFLSFDKKVHFYTYWKSIAIAVLIVGFFFLIWDEAFTRWGVWGFTPKYLLKIYFGHLPLEEVMFFFIVPYNCVFIHEVQKAYFTNLNLSKLAKGFTVVFLSAALLLAIFNFKNYYTFSATATSILLTIYVVFKKFEWFPRFVLTYLICFVPFFIVNGILTGMFTPEPVVWYSESHIVGWRIVTIPMEDLFYNYSLLLPIIWIHEWLKPIFGLARAK